MKRRCLKGDWRKLPSIRPRSKSACKKDTGGEIKAVLVVQVDTASGAYNDIQAIRFCHGRGRSQMRF